MNAIKFTYPGGNITLLTEIKGKDCFINVVDNGSGIPIGKQSDLFTLAAKSTFGTGNEKGAGLGLVLCSEFIKLQGGQMGFISEQNIGSTFFVSLNYVLRHLLFLQ